MEWGFPFQAPLKHASLDLGAIRKQSSDLWFVFREESH